MVPDDGRQAAGTSGTDRAHSYSASIGLRLTAATSLRVNRALPLTAQAGARRHDALMMPVIGAAVAAAALRNDQPQSAARRPRSRKVSHRAHRRRGGRETITSGADFLRPPGVRWRRSLLVQSGSARLEILSSSACRRSRSVAQPQEDRRVAGAPKRPAGRAFSV